MKYIECPRCRARFHTGVIYEPPEACSRCGASLSPPGRPLRAAVRELLKHSRVRDSLDWEAITGSQYIRRRVIARDPRRRGNTTSPA